MSHRKKLLRTCPKPKLENYDSEDQNVHIIGNLSEKASLRSHADVKSTFCYFFSLKSSPLRLLVEVNS